jgi:DNA-binding transcriptional MerR regulator
MAMARRYFRVTEIVKICRVSESFVRSLERENLITPKVRRKQKVYSLDQVDRVRVAQVLMRDMGVNLEGVEVALHMREQIITMRRELIKLSQSIGS